MCAPGASPAARPRKALEAAGITANKNTIPFDPQKPMIASGIRLGTAALTTRGMQEPEMVRVAGLIDRTLRAAGGRRRPWRGWQPRPPKLAAAFPLYTSRSG